MRNHETRIIRKNNQMFIPGRGTSLALLVLVSVSLLSGCATYTPDFRDTRDQIQANRVAEIVTSSYFQGTTKV